jgi:hypothetical protein
MRLEKGSTTAELNWPIHPRWAPGLDASRTVSLTCRIFANGLAV